MGSKRIANTDQPVDQKKYIINWERIFGRMLAGEDPNKVIADLHREEREYERTQNKR